jgi:hypothetical protein
MQQSVNFGESSCPLSGLPFMLYRVGKTPTVVYKSHPNNLEDIYIQWIDYKHKIHYN